MKCKITLVVGPFAGGDEQDSHAGPIGTLSISADQYTIRPDLQLGHGRLINSPSSRSLIENPRNTESQWEQVMERFGVRSVFIAR